MVLGAHIKLCVTESDFWSKMALNMVFGLFKKMTSLVLSGICVKWKFLWFINIMRKLHAWERSGSQVIAKNGPQPMRFLYSLIAKISLWFWDVDRHEWKNQGSLTCFMKKKKSQGKWAILGPKIVHPHNSGFARRIF